MPRLAMAPTPARQRDLVQVLRRVLLAVVVQVEAVEHPPALRQVEAGIHPLTQAAGVKAEIELRVGRDLAEEADVQTREDRETSDRTGNPGPGRAGRTRTDPPHLGPA